jgi:hypothetical protein
VLQDTGFSEVVPTGEGILAFTDIEGAVRAVNEIEKDYSHHSAAARQIAERVFGHREVLGDLLRRIGLG